MLEEHEIIEDLTPETLNTPLDGDDGAELAENLDTLYFQLRVLFSRARQQYRGDTWISNELWAFAMQVQGISERYNDMMEAGVFPGIVHR